MSRFLMPALIVLLLVAALALVLSNMSMARDFGTFGKTFTIKEEDLIEYMQRRMPELNVAELEDRARTPAPVIGLSRTEHERVFFHDPTYTVKADIVDHEGRIVHKAGTVVNPFDHVQWGSDMVLIDGHDQKQIDWLKAGVANGSGAAGAFEGSRDLAALKIVLVQGSPLKLEEQLGVSVYFDQAGFITNQLGIKHMPAIVTQADRMLKITEVKSDVSR